MARPVPFQRGRGAGSGLARSGSRRYRPLPRGLASGPQRRAIPRSTVPHEAQKRLARMRDRCRALCSGRCCLQRGIALAGWASAVQPDRACALQLHRQPRARQTWAAAPVQLNAGWNLFEATLMGCARRAPDAAPAPAEARCQATALAASSARRGGLAPDDRATMPATPDAPAPPVPGPPTASRANQWLGVSAMPGGASSGSIGSGAESSAGRRITIAQPLPSA